MTISWEERIKNKAKKKFSFASNNVAFVFFLTINLGFLSYLKFFQKNEQVRKKLKIIKKGKQEKSDEKFNVGPWFSSSKFIYI
jgi:hypothetical protein